MNNIYALASKWLLDHSTKKNNQLIENLKENNTNVNVNTNEIIKELLLQIKPIHTQSLIGHDVYRDIEFFENINTNTFKTPTIYDNFQHTLIGSEEISKKVLSTPVSCIKSLKERQYLIKDTESKLSQGLDQKLIENMKQYENDVLWLYQDLDKNIDSLQNMVYFRINVLQPLNNSGSLLSGWNIYKILVSPLIGILSPIIYFIVPYFILTYKFKLNMSLKTYIKLMYTAMTSQDFLLGGLSKYRAIKIVSYLFSMLFYFQGLFNSVEISRTLYKMSNYLVDKMNNVVSFLKDSQSLINKYWDPRFMSCYVSDNLTLIPENEEKEYIDKLDIIDFSLFSNFGVQLKNYKFVNKDIINSVLSKVYIIDSMFSIIKFKNKNNLVYTEFIEHHKPYMRIKSLWHPSISLDKAVTNDVTLGNDTFVEDAKDAKKVTIPNNAIITGTNAAGKSLLIKSILVNALLSQTCTISISKSCKMTPFTLINSQISIPDCTGHESLFQAEMHRCKKNLDSLKILDKNSKALIIVDEIFNSTNPVEAIAGGYSICKKMSEYSNLVMVFTTHYSYLTKLSKTNKFKNYKMETLFVDNAFKFTYKLKEGINKHYIALELLKKEGFDDEILDEAILIKNKLIS